MQPPTLSHGIPTFLARSEQTHFFLMSANGFLVQDPYTQSVGPVVKISVKRGTLFIDGRPSYAKAISVTPYTGSFTYKGQQYSGTFIIYQDKKRGWYLSPCPASLSLAPWINKVINAEQSYQVKVLLEEKPRVNTASLWQLRSKGGFKIVDPGSAVKHLVKKNEISLSFFNKHFMIEGTPVAGSTLIIVPQEGHLHFQGKEYQGNFLITQTNTDLYLINVLDIEDYVFSVLKTESWPGWPLEVNKAFAVASRTYVIGIIMNDKNKGLPYHVRNTNKHQTYTGVHYNVILKQAVEQTKGIFLVHHKKPIVAMFDICCGGVIPAHIHGVNFHHAPYLARPYACTYCKNAKVFNWYAEYPLHDLEDQLKKELTPLKKLRDVTIAKRDKAGLVQMVHARAGRNYSLSGKKLYGLLDKVKSFCFTAKKSNNRVIFKGKGYGHHLGLCQWGAREMVRRGHDYQSVLSFYYPQTQFMRLT